MDVFSQEKRSEVMSKVRSKNNKSTELRFLKLLKENRVKGWRRHLNIVGCPDFAFPQKKVAVFLDGSFWHGHPKSKLPSTNKKFWKEKIEANKRRDRKVNRELRAVGWKVIRIWDFQISKKPELVIGRVKRKLEK